LTRVSFFYSLDRGGEFGFRFSASHRPSYFRKKATLKGASLDFMTNCMVGPTTRLYMPAHTPTATRGGFLIDEPNQSAAPQPRETKLTQFLPTNENKGIDGIDGWRSLRSLSPPPNLVAAKPFCLPIGVSISLRT
jgi:hypothetical protein